MQDGSSRGIVAERQTPDGEVKEVPCFIDISPTEAKVTWLWLMDNNEKASLHVTPSYFIVMCCTSVDMIQLTG